MENGHKYLKANINLVEEFDNLISIYAKEDIIDFWYDDGVCLADNILKKFDEEDYKMLIKLLPERSIIWKIRLTYYLGDKTKLSQLDILLQILNRNDCNSDEFNNELFETVIDSLRIYKDKNLINRYPEVIKKVENYLKHTNSEPVRKMFEDFLNIINN